MQPVGTAVSVVCVRAMVSSFNSQHWFHNTGGKKLSMEGGVEY